MKRALAIAAADIRTNWLILLAGPVVGLSTTLWDVLVQGHPLVPKDPAQVPIEVVLGVVILFQLLLAAGLGGSAISRDLGERRLGFYLARPVSPLAYWSGKLAAAYVLAYATGWLMCLHGLLLGAIPMPVFALMFTKYGAFVAAGAIGTALFAAGGAAVAAALRSPSGFLVLDMIMIPATIAAFVMAWGATWQAGTSQAILFSVIPGVVVAAVLVLFAAGAAHVALGRTELRRGHRWLSAVAWSGLLACAGAIALASRVVASTTPADHRLGWFSFVDGPPSGASVFMNFVGQGWRRRYDPAFLLDPSGRFVRLGGFDGFSGAAWSDDGRHFAWSKGAMFRDSPNGLQAMPGLGPTISIAGLDGATTRVLPRPHVEQEWVIALSPSGRRLLLATPKSKVLVDAESGREIARVDDAYWREARFVSETLVRAIRMFSGPSRIVDWNTASGVLTERGSLAADPSRRLVNGVEQLLPTDDWTHVLRIDAAGMQLHDLDGRVVATPLAWTTPTGRVAGLLSGGRFGALERDAEGVRLRVFSPGGEPTVDVRFKSRLWLQVGGEIAPNLLALSTLSSAVFGERETLFVDLADGRVVAREKGLSPVLQRWRGEFFAGSPNPLPGSFATRLFVADEGLVLLDPATRARTVIVRQQAAREEE